MTNPFNSANWLKGFKFWMDKTIESKQQARKLKRENPRPTFTGGIDYTSGIDPLTDLVNTGHCYITHKIVDGEPVAEYHGGKLDMPFPDLMKDMLKYYPSFITKERTDEDVMMELKAIKMFKPEVLKEFIENHYGK